MRDRRKAILLVMLLPSIACGPPARETTTGDGGDGGKDDGGLDAGSQGPMGTFDAGLVVDGLTRTYLLHVPATVPASDAPVVFGQHGAGDDPWDFAMASGLLALSDEKGFILVAPAALQATWVYPLTLQSFSDDTDFILQLLARLETQYRIDPKRLYACGVSRGATFSGSIATGSNQATALEGYSYINPFAAFGLSATQNQWDVLYPDLYQGQNIDLSQTMPKRPIWIIAGTSDNVIPFADDQTFVNELRDGGWDATLTPVPFAPHDWLWHSSYGHPIEDLWTFFVSNPLP